MLFALTLASGVLVPGAPVAAAPAASGQALARMSLEQLSHHLTKPVDTDTLQRLLSELSSRLHRAADRRG